MSGKIIKKTISRSEVDDVGDSDSSLIDGEIYDASQTAKDLIQKADRQSEATIARARDEAEGIVQAATQEQERLIREATDQGYQEGLASSTEWVVRAREHYQRAVDGNKNDLKLLAVKIAEKIIGRALEMDPTLINDIVTQALRTTRQQKNVVIRCNEEDYDHLKENEKEFLDLMGQHGTIDIVVDTKIIRGGCIVDSELGVVDARLDVQLKKLQKVLTSK